MKLEYPFEGKFRITQKFGKNPKVYKKFGLAGHDGLDYATPNGTKLLAPMAGKTYVGWAPKSWGIFYSITNDWGTVYLCHLKENYLPTGVQVATRQLIGETNNTGFSTGPHLHIGLRIKGTTNSKMKNFVDPLPYFENEEPKDVVEAGQDTAIEGYQQNIEDLSFLLKLPAGNKDFVLIKKKCAELMITAKNHQKFIKEVAQGIGCADESGSAVLDALVGLEARISATKRRRLKDFTSPDLVSELLRRIWPVGGEK